jgi:hypothetical protein
MDNSFQTSFIPKKPINSSTYNNKTTKSLFLVFSILILVLTCLSTVGLFLYKKNLEDQKEVLSSSLAKIRESFEKDTIDELSSFDQKTKYARQILDNHIVITPFFKSLSKVTIPSIQYTSLNIKNSKNNVSIEIKGLAKDYRSIALQAGIFNSAEGSDFSNVLFYNLVKDNKSNNVSFGLKFNVKPSLLSYKNNLEK